MGVRETIILDSGTKQISHADVFFSDTVRLLRIPWESFESNMTASD